MKKIGSRIKGRCKGPRPVAALACLLGALLCAVTLCVGTASAISDEADLSFYKLASAATTYYRLSTTDSSDNGKTLDNFKANEGTEDPAQMVNAGGFMGFADEADGIAGLIARVASGEQQVNYGDYQSGGTEALYAFAAYGHALGQLGLDETKNASLDMAFIIRSISGFFLRAAYMFAESADTVMVFAINVLKFLNPFQLLADSDYLSAFAGTGGDGIRVNELVSPLTKGTDSAKATIGSAMGVVDGFDVLAPIRATMSTYYDWAYRFGFLFLAFGLALLAVTTVFKRRFDRPKAGKWLRRLAFVVLGVPLLAFTYTGVLNGIADMFSEAKAGGHTQQDNVIMQTLVDFEGWATNAGLALPSGYTVVVECADDGPGQVTKVTDPSGNVCVVTDDLVCQINDNWGRKYREFSAESDQACLAGLRDCSEEEGSAEMTESDYAVDLLNRYTDNALFAASSFESRYKANLGASMRAKLFDSMEEVSKVDTLVDAGKKKGEDDPKPKSYFVPDGADNFSSDGDPSEQDRYNALAAMHDGKSSNLKAALDHYSTGNYRGASITYTGGNTTGDGRGLSTLATYNYLTTSFEDSNLKTYSSNKLGSSVTVRSHNSANLAGGNFAVKFVNWLRAVSLLVAIGVVGWFYGVAMMMTALKRLFMTIAQIPAAVMGSLVGAAKLVTGVFLVVAEIVLTIAIYAIAADLIVAISGAIPTIAGTIVAATPIGGAAGAIGSLFSLVSVVVNILLCVCVCKARKGLVSAFDEMIGRSVDSVFGTTNDGKDGQGAGHEMGDAMKAAAPAGAGALAGMAASKDASKDSEKKEGAEGEGAWDPKADTDTLEDEAEDGSSGDDVQDGPDGGSVDPDGKGGADPSDEEYGRAAEESGAESCQEVLDAAEESGSEVPDDYLPAEAMEGADGEGGADGDDGTEAVEGAMAGAAAAGAGSAAAASQAAKGAKGADGSAKADGTSPKGGTAVPAPGAVETSSLVDDGAKSHPDADGSGADGIEASGGADSDGSESTGADGENEGRRADASTGGGERASDQTQDAGADRPGTHGEQESQKTPRASKRADGQVTSALRKAAAVGASQYSEHRPRLQAPTAPVTSASWKAVDGRAAVPYARRHQGDLATGYHGSTTVKGGVVRAVATGAGAAASLGARIGSQSANDHLTEREQRADQIALQKAQLQAQNGEWDGKMPFLYSDEYKKRSVGAGPGADAAKVAGRAGGFAKEKVKEAVRGGTDKRDRKAYGRYAKAAAEARNGAKAAERLGRAVHAADGGGDSNLKKILKATDPEAAIRLARAARSLDGNDGLFEGVREALENGGQMGGAASAAADPATRQALADLPAVARDVHDDFVSGNVAADDAASKAAKSWLYRHPEAFRRAMAVAEAGCASRMRAAAIANDRESAAGSQGR